MNTQEFLDYIYDELRRNEQKIQALLNEVNAEKKKVVQLWRDDQKRRDEELYIQQSILERLEKVYKDQRILIAKKLGEFY